jgi:hypothetical protein
MRRRLRFDTGLMKSALDFLPVAAGMGVFSAVAFGQVATKQATDHGRSSAKDEEENAGGEPAGDVREEKDHNTGVHQYGQYDS